MLNGLRISAAGRLQTAILAELMENGYAVLPNVFSAAQIDAITHEMATAFAQDADGSTLRSADGSIYGARNLLRLWPGVADVWKQRPIPEVLGAILGSRFGLVRVLYFDKPPEQSWALPWHQDRTIAVKNNRLASAQFGKPTFKVGVPHVEAPEWLLEQMLTLRLHLDDMTDDNGPLRVMPGSHRSPSGNGVPATILGQRGDALLMRPLLSHCSNKSSAATRQHRRVLHYEFAAVEQLPDGYAWHDFVPGGDGP